MSQRDLLDILFAISGFIASSMGRSGGLIHSTCEKPASSNCWRSLMRPAMRITGTSQILAFGEFHKGVYPSKSGGLQSPHQ